MVIGDYLARPESEPATPLASRLRSVRRDIGDPDRTDFAERVGISKNTLAFYERGERTPDASTLAIYRDRLGIDLNWLVTGAGAPGAIGLAQLPVFDIRASAGLGIPVGPERRLGAIAFDPAFLRAQGARPDQCSVIAASGDSMQPTIPDGALLVVDHSQTEPRNGHIMVLNVGDDLLVKRIRRRLDGRIDLISDNPAYEPETLGPDAIRQLRVIGRVAYFCRAP